MFINDNNLPPFALGNTTNDNGGVQVHMLPVMQVAYGITFLASLFGNSVIIHIIRTDNSLKTTTNYLIMNQACADLLITFSELSNTIYHSFTGSLWPEGFLGLITCKMYLAFLFSPPNFSAWILAVIAVDRFYAVVLPLRQSPTSQHLKKIILILWLWSFAWSVHLIIAENFRKVEGSYYCDISSLANNWTIFNIITLILNVLLPLMIIVGMYTAVCHKLWSREVPGEGANQNEALRIAKKVIVMMIVVVVLYVLCWFPLFILVALNSFRYVQLEGNLLYFVMWLPPSYSGLNPYVYLTFSQNFRKGFKRLLRRVLSPIHNINPTSFRSQSIELEQI